MWSVQPRPHRWQSPHGEVVMPTGITRYLGPMAMTLRLTDEQAAKLREAAARENLSVHAVVLKAIDQYVDQRIQRRQQILADIVTEDAGLLTRLADA